MSVRLNSDRTAAAKGNNGRDRSNPPNGATMDSFDKETALNIYNAADQIHHSRIQSFLLTQTFFVVAFVEVHGAVPVRRQPARSRHRR
jgi:hypothetical protein